MRTKTGELLMRKKHEVVQSRNEFNTQDKSLLPPEAENTAKRHPSHISHVNEYAFITCVNKLADPQPNSEVLRQLELQNYRLIE